MAEILTIKKSYKAIKMQLFELKKIEPETQGLCGNCDNVRFKRMVDRLKASGLTAKEPKILTYPYQGGIEEIEIEGEE